MNLRPSPVSTEDAKNVVVEIRAGTGGDEASIFAGDLYRMYTKYCQSKGWKVSFVDSSEGTAGGFKEVIFEVAGEDIYGTMKYESGVHRVQRVPQTETQGRVHTSAPTVMVLPEAEEFDVEIDMNEVRIAKCLPSISTTQFWLITPASVNSFLKLWIKVPPTNSISHT